MSKDLVSVEHQEATSTSKHASHSGLPDPPDSSSAELLNATTSTDTANNIGHLCGSESLSLTVQNILGELRQLTQALKASGRVCHCQDSKNGKEFPAPSAAEANFQQGTRTLRGDETSDAAGSSSREIFQAEFHLLDETCQDITKTQQAKEEFLESLKESVEIQWLGRELLAKFQPDLGPPSEGTKPWFDYVWSMGQKKCLGQDEELGQTSKWYPLAAKYFASYDAVSSLSEILIY